MFKCELKCIDNSDCKYSIGDEGKVVVHNGITNSLIFSTIVTAMNSIEESNIPNWLIRIDMLKSIGYQLGVQQDDAGSLVDWWPTESDLRDHIGLRTNARFKTEEELLDTMERWVSIASKRGYYDTDTLIDMRMNVNKSYSTLVFSEVA